jgi:hypothetical protein
MICDQCGVKLTTRAARRQRFGHIDLPGPIAHPLGQKGEQLGAIPVLPAAFVESPSGAGLADIYDDLVRQPVSESLENVVASFDRLVRLLLPAIVLANEWDLQDAELLTCGLALVPHIRSVHDTCGSCGYPLEGLDVPVCPGCGKKLR